MTVHEKFPIGTLVRYNGGCDIGSDMLVPGSVYEITENDVVFGQPVSGFSPSNGAIPGDFYAISDGTGGFGMIPDTAQYFELVVS